MKKPSINFGEGGIQGFLGRHVEKLVLGIAVLLVVMFVYFGWSIKPYEKTPDSLKSVAERAQQHIKRDTWDDVKGERVPPTGLKKIVETSRMATDPQPYWTPLPLTPPTKALHTKRRDPALYPPIKLEVVAITGAVAMKPRRGLEDLLASVANAEPPKESDQDRKRREARKRREQDRKKRKPGGGSGGGVPGMGDGMSGMEGLFGSGGGPEGAMPEGGGEAPPGMMGGLFGGGGQGTPAAAGIRRFRGKVEGWKSGDTVGGGMSGPGMSGPGMPGMPDMGSPGASGPGTSGPGSAQPSGNANVIPESHSFVAVKALVPFEKQFDEYERVLEGPFYEAARDMPRYIYLWVERAEVGDDPDAALAWTQLETWRAERIAEQYGGVVREVADLKFVDIAKICHPVPPLLMHSLDDLMSHPDLPKTMKQEAKPDAADSDDPTKEPGHDLPGGDFPTGRSPSVGPPGMADGMGPPGMADGMGPPGMADGMGPPGMADGMGPPGMGMPGYGGRGGTSGAAFEVPKYKLVRFFDFSVAPGKTYKYRVKLFAEDPNNPNPSGRYAAPAKRMLASEVVTRLEDPNRDKKEFWRTTEWSEPSDAVTVPTPGRLLAGMVSRGKTAKLNERVIQLTEDRGKFVPVVWDKRYAVDIPAERDVFRGTMLNFQRDAEVVHPLSLIIKMLEAYNFQTDSLVVDLRGGEELPGKAKEKMTAPGEFAMIDGSGKLVVRNELDDMEAFRRFTLAEEKEQDSGSSTGSPFGGAPGSDDGGGLFGPGGMGPPGMGPPGMGPPGMAPN